MQFSGACCFNNKTVALSCLASFLTFTIVVATVSRFCLRSLVAVAFFCQQEVCFSCYWQLATLLVVATLVLFQTMSLRIDDCLVSSVLTNFVLVYWLSPFMTYLPSIQDWMLYNHPNMEFSLLVDGDFVSSFLLSNTKIY